MTIKQTETGLSNADYATMQSAIESHKYKIELHKWNLDFTNTPWHTSTVSTDQRDDSFTTVSLNGHFIRWTWPGNVEVWDGVNWNAYTTPTFSGGIMFPVASMYADQVNNVLWLYVIASNGIWVTKSTTYGTTWLSWSFVTSTGFPAYNLGVTHVTCYAPGRIFFTVSNNTTNLVNIYHAAVGTYPTHTITQENVSLVTGPSSIAAALVPDADDPFRCVLLMAMDVPGRTAAQYIGGKVVTYIYRSGGLVGWFREQNQMSDHFDIDVFDNVTTYLYRYKVRVSNLNGVLIMTAVSGDGSPSFHSMKYRYYTSKDGYNWSSGFMIPYIPATQQHGIDIVSDGTYAYLCNSVNVWRCSVTGLLNHSTVIEDITDYVLQYSFSASDLATSQMILSNEDAHFDSFEAVADTYALVQYWGFDNGPMVQTAIHEIDEWVASEQTQGDEYKRTVQVVGRDRFGWMIDLVQSEWAHYWQNQLTGTDLFQDTTGTSYGGLTHTAPASGMWKTMNNSLFLASNNEEGVAFDTYSTDMWNGHKSIGFMLSSTDATEYAGVVFRAIDHDNLWAAIYHQSDGSIHLIERRAGTDVDHGNTGNLGWSAASTHYFIRVVFRYASIAVFTSTNGTVWTVRLSYTMNGVFPQVSDSAVVTERPYERGSTGTIGYGFSALDNWDDDPGNIDVPDFISPDGYNDAQAYPGSRVAAKPLIQDNYNPYFIWELDGQGRVRQRRAGSIILDVSLTSGELAALGTPLKMIFDKQDYGRFYILGTNQILMNPNVYAPSAAAFWTVLASADSGYAYSSDLAQDPTLYSRFFWFSTNPPTAMSGSVDIYFNYTYDSFATVGKILMWSVTLGGIQNFPTGFGIALSYFNNLSKGYLWVSTGNVASDPRPGGIQAGLAGIYFSTNWGSSFTQIIGSDPFIPTTGFPSAGPGWTDYWINYWWGTPVMPYLKTDGTLNSADEGLLTYFFGYPQSINGASRTGARWYSGSGIDLVTHVVDAGWGFNGPGEGASIFNSGNSQAHFASAISGSTIHVGEIFSHYGSTVNYFFNNARGTGQANTQLGSPLKIYGPGLNGWPTNPNWLVTFGSDGYAVWINATLGSGLTPFFTVPNTSGTVTAFPDPIEFSDTRKKGFGYDHTLTDAIIDPSDPGFDDIPNDGWDVDPYGNPFPPFPLDTAVSFIHSQVNDTAFPRTLEDGFRSYAGFAGITDFEFNTLYQNTASDPNWTVVAGTLVDDGSKLTFSGTNGKAVWGGSYLPHSILWRGFVNVSAGLGIALNLRSADSSAFTLPHYIVGADSSAQPTIYKYNAVTHTRDVVMRISGGVLLTGEWRISCREMVYSADTDNIWLVISLWVNRQLVMTYTEWIKESPVTDYYWGLERLSGNTSINIGHVAIPQLTEFVEYDSINSGQSPMEALQQALDGRYIYYFIRWNGKLRAWKYSQIPTNHTFTNDDIYTAQRTLDHRTIITHARMVGAYVDAEYVDDSLGIHRYKELKNPYLMSELECYREAINSINRSKEQSDTMAFTGPYRPLLEIGDRVTTPNGDYIINSYDINFTSPMAIVEYQCRRYIYGA